MNTATASLAPSTDAECRLDRRREDVRQSTMAGIEFVETGASQSVLEVHFLGKAPANLSATNVRITGDTPVTVVRARVYREEDSALDDWMEVQLQEPGDWSTYTLMLVQSAGDETPMAGFDPLFASATFGFKVDCPSDLDCCASVDCPPTVRLVPDIDYLAKDYESFRRLILDRLALTSPAWTETHVPDIGVMLVELLAYAGDQLSYHQDAVATEAYLNTARLRISLRRHARLVDYAMHEGCNARAWLTIEVDADTPLDLSGVAFCTSFPGAPADGPLSPAAVAAAPAGSVEWFEPLLPGRSETVELRVAHNRIEFYAWCDCACCLPIGTTAATLLDQWVESPTPNGPPAPAVIGDPAAPPTAGAPQAADEPRPRSLDLKVGDVLVLEEVLGPRTGNPADADPSHRQAVRLTRVTAGIDALYDGDDGGRPIVQVEWCPEDALRFPLCLSAVMPAPDCDCRGGISVARGNVLLVDSGCSIGQTLDPVPSQSTVVTCADDCSPARQTDTPPSRYGPCLVGTGLTFAQPIVAPCCASDLVSQDPRSALPAVVLVAGVASGTSSSSSTSAAAMRWTAVPDLLESGPDDRVFVVEIDDDGTPHLRFGNDAEGRRPDSGTVFRVHARWGVGPDGNVGAESITRIVFTGGITSGRFAPRNPMAASGGTAPESAADVRMLAPTALRSRLERAVTAADYQTLADDNARRLDERPGSLCDVPFQRLQGSKATLRWNGAWYEVVLALDPLGRESVDAELLDDVHDYLEPYRRIGDDLRAGPAAYVPLDIGLSVCVALHVQRAHVKSRLLALFGTGVLGDGSLALFNPDNLTFGNGVFASRLVATAQQVPGVVEVRLTRLSRYETGSTPPGDTPDAVPSDGAFRLNAHQIARLDNDPGRPANGRLTILVRGGR